LLRNQKISLPYHPLHKGEESTIAGFEQKKNRMQLNLTARSVAILAVAVHFAVATLHGRAHQILNIQLTKGEVLFIFLVITGAPIVAAVLVALRKFRSAGVILALSMFGSLLFGLWHHYIVISPDHISQVWYLPNRLWSLIFQITSAALALIELFGTAVGLLLLRRLPLPS
jgi:hypothetical protein